MTSYRELFRVFGRIGILSFGGPAAQIALMHRELVDRLKWVDEGEYLRALSFCMLLPGPEAMQLATYAGWRQRGILGGIIAGGLFVLPGAAIILSLAMAYGHWGNIPLIQALFMGIQAAVVIIVVEALLRVAKRALKRPVHWLIAGLAFAALFLFHLPFWAVILVAALAGFLTAQGSETPAAPQRKTPSTLPAVAGFALLWAIPLATLGLFEGGLLWDMALFFSNLAIVTFGGAYAVLAAMTQTVVQTHGWLETPQMIDALGLAETTPGPLILVTEFVGYMAAFRQGGMLYGIAGALVALWMTFIPCFLWVFAGAPHIHRLAAMPRLSAALAAITAAVVGVIANLSIWFAAHVAFGRVTETSFGPLHLLAPDWSSLNPVSLALTALAALLLLRLHKGLALTLALCGALGVASHLAGLA
ncbi:chromate efflux transporter [Neogemmobacter tilapiae]|uniref:Chromate transporter n=1 Tax=Neogemmobacter tilapiae TaxID=875041 RepID=A0A918TZR6_9RHOB|nr:chromate efflux transporter [Gemmobacter tilapiae]GHC67134.1 chromate transporter [Gemmobacter tilapiae]